MAKTLKKYFLEKSIAKTIKIFLFLLFLLLKVT